MNGWFLPVDDGMVNPKAKFHYFQEDTSLCGHHCMNTDYYETDMKSCGLEFSEAIVCKQCLKKLQKVSG